MTVYTLIRGRGVIRLDLNNVINVAILS